MVGPPRSQFVPGGQARGSHGQGGPGEASVVQSEKPGLSAGQGGKDLSAQGRSPELVPEKYRQALKRYFSQPEATP